MPDKKRLLVIKRAIKSNDVDAVHRLVTESAGLVTGEGNGWTPFEDAAFQAKTKIVKIMLAQGAGISPADIAHALHHAVQLPHIDPDLVETLIATGQVAKPFVSLYRGDVETLSACLRGTPDVDTHSASRRWNL